MSTIGYSSWAVDLADVGAVYPFQGLEGLMLLLGLAFWLIWMVHQTRAETRQIEEDCANGSGENIHHAIDHH